MEQQRKHWTILRRERQEQERQNYQKSRETAEKEGRKQIEAKGYKQDNRVGNAVLAEKTIFIFGIAHRFVFTISPMYVNGLIFSVCLRQEVEREDMTLFPKGNSLHGWGMLYGSGTFNTVEEAEEFVAREFFAWLGKGSAELNKNCK